MLHAMDLWVIVLNWNGAADTEACVETLRAAAGRSFTVLVVDNGSVDESCERLLARFPDLALLRLPANQGFSGGNNAGIRRALERGATHVLVLNNDTVVPARCIDALAEAVAADPRIGAASPVIFKLPKTEEVWYAGGTFDRAQGRPAHVLQAPPETAPVSDTYYATGCAMLLSAEALRRVGDFEEDYFALWEDADLSLRIRRAGWRVVLVASARLYHKVGATYQDPVPSLSPRYGYLNARNHLYWLGRHFAGPERVALTWKAFVSFARRLVHARRLGRSDVGRAARATLLGIRDWLFGRMGPFPADL